MKRSHFSLLLGLIILAFTASMLVGQADQGANTDREGGRRRFGEGRPDRSGPNEWRARREEFHRRMTERLRELLEVNEEEWAVLKPRVEKVTQLRRSMRGRRGRVFDFGLLGGRGHGGRARTRSGGGRIDSERRSRPDSGPGGEDNSAQLERSDIEQCSEALQDLLEDDTASNDQITEALTALRKARETARVELEQARRELRDLCTLKQEARFVSLHILE